MRYLLSQEAVRRSHGRIACHTEVTLEEAP
jgi:hypothetical protein